VQGKKGSTPYRREKRRPKEKEQKKVHSVYYPARKKKSDSGVLPTKKKKRGEPTGPFKAEKGENGSRDCCQYDEEKGLACCPYKRGGKEAAQILLADGRKRKRVLDSTMRRGNRTPTGEGKGKGKASPSRRT